MKFWDTRTSTPAAVVNLCERAYSMDTRGAMMVVATANRKVGPVNYALIECLAESVVQMGAWHASLLGVAVTAACSHG